MKDILLLTKHQKQSLDLKGRRVLHLSSVNSQAGREVKGLANLKNGVYIKNMEKDIQS